MVNRQDLLEYAKVFDHYYGTPRPPVEEALSQGHDVLFDIDWQGTQQLDERARDDLVSVFILPPSTKELERRLHTRAPDSASVIAGRLDTAADEITHLSEDVYVVVTVDFEGSVRLVQAVLDAQRDRGE